MSASPLGRLLVRLGPEVDDPDEETFLLLAHERPSAQNLGFIDSHAAVLDLTVAGRDLTIHQSPAVLTSNRSGGTTGAVLWKITPAMAEWLARPDNVFFGGSDLLGPHSAVLELGCGIAGVIGLALTGKGTRAAQPATQGAPKKRGGRANAKRTARDTLSPSPSIPSAASFATANTVSRYVLTDQPYVAKFLQRNLEENGAQDGTPLLFEALDWETDEVTPAGRLGGVASFDAVVACDCIYNEALVAPLVQTCVDVCKLRKVEADTNGDDTNGVRPPTICIVAQQLRDPDVLTAWLTAFAASFRVWRVPEALLTPALLPTAGFAVHVGILKDE